MTKFPLPPNPFDPGFNELLLEELFIIYLTSYLSFWLTVITLGNFLVSLVKSEGNINNFCPFLSFPLPSTACTIFSSVRIIIKRIKFQDHLYHFSSFQLLYVLDVRLQWPLTAIHHEEREGKRITCNIRIKKKSVEYFCSPHLANRSS